MGLASALNTALTGLTASETIIDVVGNNLANSGTVGFKASEVNFATQLLQTQSLGSGPTSTSGGTNPRQVGLGVKVAEVTPDFNQGTIEVSSSPSDLAIQGDGFFIVQDTSGEQLYTRNGIFKTNSANELVTINGQRLLGYGVDDNFELQNTELQPITIPLGSASVAKATENVVFQGNLIPTGDLATTAEIMQSAVLGDASFDVPTYPTVGSDIAVANPPTAGTFAGASAGAGATLAAGDYNYKIVYYDANNNETASTTISVTLAAGATGIDLTDVPVDGSGDYVGRKLYRTAVNPTSSSPYYLVGTLADQTATTFSDTTDDVTLVTGAAQNTNTLTGNYSYYVTFFKPGVPESRPSILTTPINITGERLRLDNIPAPTGEYATPPSTIRIYRNTAGQANSFYRVAEISPLAVGEVYIDYAQDSAITSNPTLDFDGPKITSNTLLTNVIRRNGSTYESPFGVGTLEFVAKKGDKKLGALNSAGEIIPQGMAIDAATTVQDLVNFMEQSWGIQEPDSINGIPNDITGQPPGGSILSTGQLQFIGNNGVKNAINFASLNFISASSTTPQAANISLASVQAAKGLSASSSITVHDSLGTKIQLNVTYDMESQSSTATVYRWYADSGDNDPSDGSARIAVGTGLITFDNKGNVVPTTSPPKVNIDRSNINAVSPLTFELDFSQISGLSSDKGNLVQAKFQDGSSAGELTSFIIGEDGLIRGVFSNGNTRDLGQIQLARFANPSGLEQRGQNLFGEGVNSGLPIKGSPGAQGIGSIIAGAQELSNTDIGKNLIDLILASSQYRGNTRVITTAQQLLDELLNLRR